MHAFLLAAVLALPLQAPPSQPAQVVQTKAAAVASPQGSKVWIGREREFEQFISTAPFDRVERVPVGVTHPLHAFFAPGGLVAGVAFKPLPPGRQSGYYESYKSEIAAYLLDKMLGLGMVPPTVERKYKGEEGSAQLWVEHCRLLKTVDTARAPDPAGWNRQVYRQRVWDNLIGNIDRNQGNLLIDDEWNLVLIDHSRAFTSTPRMPFQMTRIDREFYARLQSLTKDDVQRQLGDLLADGSGPLLNRRNMIVKHFQKLIAKQGEAAVLVP
jgi:hypothetical protein